MLASCRKVFFILLQAPAQGSWLSAGSRGSWRMSHCPERRLKSSQEGCNGVVQCGLSICHCLHSLHRDSGYTQLLLLWSADEAHMHGGCRTTSYDSRASQHAVLANFGALCPLPLAKSQLHAVWEESLCVRQTGSLPHQSTSCGVKILRGSKRGSTPTGPPGGGMILGRLSGAGQLQTHCCQRHTLFPGDTDALHGCTQARCNLTFAR